MSRRRWVMGSRAALGWAAVFFVCSQLAFNAFIDGWHPELYDPEFDVRMSLLRERMAERPGRPLLLFLGSSRTVMSFRPEVLPPLRTAGGEEALVFNFSHLAAGPVMNLMELRRLLRHGVRPDWLVVELMPPCLGKEGSSTAQSSAEVRDLPLLARYFSPWKVYGQFLRSRLVPWYKHRQAFLRYYAPELTPPLERTDRDRISLQRLGGDDSWLLEARVDPEKIRRYTESARQGYFPALQNFRLADNPVRATAETLDLCRRHHIPLVMVLTPEGTEFLNWYSPEALGQVHAYCARLAREYGVPVIDARRWLADSDFLDAHHVLTSGADHFTLRLGQDVLRPFVQGSVSELSRHTLPATPTESASAQSWR